MKLQKRAIEPWHRDVEELLEKSVVEEAVHAVSSRFDEALNSLDAESFSLIQKFFDGQSLEALAREKNVSRAEIESWVAQIKLKLTQQLRDKCKVKQ